MLIPTEREKDLIYSLIFDEYEKFEEIILKKNINYKRVISIISSNRIEYFILNKLNSSFRSYLLPINFLKELKKNYFIKSIPTLKNIEKVFQLSEKLLRSNIQHVFLKGISLYDQNEIYMRPMRDIDILVNPIDIPKVIGIANSLNFNFRNIKIDLSDNYIKNSSLYDLPLMEDNNGVFLEIHFRITTDTEKCFLLEALFEKKRLIKVHNNEVCVPCFDSLFTHLVFHSSKKGYFDVGLMALVDLIQIFDKVDRNEVLKISKNIELQEMTELFIELIESNKIKNLTLNDKVEKLKEVLIFPALNSKITEIFIQESFLDMFRKFKDILFVSKYDLQKEFGTNGSSAGSFYLLRRWTRQINKFFLQILFVFKNLILVVKRAKIINDLIKK